MSANLLIELGTEELPPKSLPQLAEGLAAGVVAGLDQRQLGHGGAKWFATPRRLAVLVNDLQAKAADQTVEVQGPPADRARDKDGNWTPAANGFARKQGVAPDELITVDTDKGPRLAYRSVRPGAEVQSAVPAILDEAVAQLPIPKRMRWGSSRAEFVRPVHWVVLLYGSEVIDAKVLDTPAGRETRGHRFHCNRALPLAQADDYQLTLENDAHVIADFSERRGRIREQVEAAGKKLGGRAVIDPDLLDEVTALVEWPVALAGSFEQRFLDVPPEALISAMAEHQKYFHVVDDAGRLLPHFITVSNIESTDPAQVVDGNERVIRPRLADAAFFFDTDKKTPLGARIDQLANIVFQEKLGTLADKTRRIAALASAIAGQVGADLAQTERAAELCKCDLVTDLVFEFDQLQGIAGSYYARHDGEPEAVANAIREHYLPRHAGDELPDSDIGCALALADRLDTLVGIFGIGQRPSGSKDPYALRRAALGVLRIITGRGYDLDLRTLLALAREQHGQLPNAASAEQEVLDYLIERFRAIYEDEGIAVEVFMAVTAKDLSEPLDIDRRVRAVHRFSQLPEAQALAAANKRVSNILAKAEGAAPAEVDAALLQADEEKALAEALAAKAAEVEPLFTRRQYTEGLEALAALREPVDRFFDNVMVMADDPALQANRLALLARLRAQFLTVADISLLVPAK